MMYYDMVKDLRVLKTVMYSSSSEMKIRNTFRVYHLRQALVWTTKQQ